MSTLSLWAIREQTGYNKHSRLFKDETSCLLCGRKVKPDAILVGMNVDNTLILEGNPSQGWFNVGPNCYRKYLVSK